MVLRKRRETENPMDRHGSVILGRVSTTGADNQRTETLAVLV